MGNYHIEEGGIIVHVLEHDAQFQRVVQLNAVERVLGQDRHRPLLVTVRSVPIQRPDQKQFPLKQEKIQNYRQNPF